MFGQVRNAFLEPYGLSFFESVVSGSVRLPLPITLGSVLLAFVVRREAPPKLRFPGGIVTGVELRQPSRLIESIAMRTGLEGEILCVAVMFLEFGEYFENVLSPC